MLWIYLHRIVQYGTVELLNSYKVKLYSIYYIINGFT